MITTVEIVQEKEEARQRVYRAISGDRHATGTTPGQALDALERLLSPEEVEGTLIVIQRFRPDAFFTAEQQARLQELMKRFHEACEAGRELPPEERQELEALIDAEWRAAIQRGAAILRKMQHPAP